MNHVLKVLERVLVPLKYLDHLTQAGFAEEEKIGRSHFYINRLLTMIQLPANLLSGSPAYLSWCRGSFRVQEHGLNCGGT